MTGGRSFNNTILAARLLLNRVSHSTLFSGPDTRLHKSRFAHPFEVADLMGGSEPRLGTHLILGIGPHNQVLSVRPKPNRQELGNIGVFAPPRHGKGLHATAQLLTWEHSVVVNDIKGEHYERTAGRRSRFSKIIVLDPRGLGNRFDPLGHCKTEDDFLAMADFLLAKPSDKQDDAFILRARGMLTALFQAGFLEGYPLLPYCAHLIHLGPEAAAERLQALSRQQGLAPDQNLATRFLDRTLANVDFADRYLQNSWANFTAIMRPIITETVIRTVAGSDFTIEELMCGDKPVTVYLRFPENRLKALAPLIRLIWSTIIDGLTSLYDDRMGAGCKPVLLLIDEAGVAPVPGLPEFAASVCGRGISLWADFQDLNQARSLYGHDRARTLLNSIETQIFYRQSGLETSEYLERALGRTSEFSHGTSTHEDSTTESETEQAVALLTAREISELSETEVLCIHRNLKPFRAKRMDWRNTCLAELTKIPPPPLPTLAPPPALASLSAEKPFRAEFIDIEALTRRRSFRRSVERTRQ